MKGAEGKAIAVVIGLVALIAASTGAYWAGQMQGARAQHVAEASAAEAVAARAACEAAAGESERDHRARIAALEARAAPACPVRHRVVTDATVTEVDGPAHVRRVDACRVELEWWTSGDEHNCRVTARCGATHLYGGVGLGFFECEREDAQITRGADPYPTSEDDDPRVELEGTTLRVHDEGPAWSVTLSLAGTREPGR